MTAIRTNVIYILKHTSFFVNSNLCNNLFLKFMDKTIFLENWYIWTFYYLTTSCVMFRSSSAYKARCTLKSSWFVFGVHVQVLLSRKRTVEISDRMSVGIVPAWDTTDEVFNPVWVDSSKISVVSYAGLLCTLILSSIFNSFTKYMNEYNSKQSVGTVLFFYVWIQ